MVAAIFLIARYFARTTLVPAFVIIRHIFLPCPLQILHLKSVGVNGTSPSTLHFNSNRKIIDETSGGDNKKFTGAGNTGLFEL